MGVFGVSGKHRGLFDALPDAKICAAAAQVSGHRFIDLRISGVRVLSKECRGGHDLSCLAVATLWHVELTPSALNWMVAVRGDSLDGRDGHAIRGGNRSETGTRRRAVQMNRAGSALTDATAKLCATELELVAKHPKQGSIRDSVNAMGVAVDLKSVLAHRLNHFIHSDPAVTWTIGIAGWIFYKLAACCSASRWP